MTIRFHRHPPRVNTRSADTRNGSTPRTRFGARRRPSTPRSIVGLVSAVAAAIALLTFLPAAPTSAHEERPAIEPAGNGSVPEYRRDGPVELVCKTDTDDFAARISTFSTANQSLNRDLFARCQREGFRDLQAAVDAVTTAGVRILVLPGLYQEEPSFAPLSDECTHLDAPWSTHGYQILSWEQQNQCPHVQNMVGIFSKHDLQIEGTGEKATDVMFDAQYRVLNAIRADRTDGIYLHNMAAEHATFNAFYVMETDGFVLDNTVGRWNDEYAFLTFADDHGLYDHCEAYGNGDSGIYPGAAHNINVDNGFDVPRYAIEVRNCYSYDNTLGYSGTAGDSVWAHDNVFTDNETGIATDSSFPDHPGLPQNHALFEHNVIGDNNQDYTHYVRDGTCARPSALRGYEEGAVCPTVGMPIGTGIFNPGGNWNIWRENYIYGNAYVGVLTTWVPGIIRNAPGWAEQFDTSHHNRYLDNVLGATPDNQLRPNGIDYWWDGQGLDNCWQSDRPAGTEPLAMPACGSGWSIMGPGTARFVAEPIKIVQLYDCTQYDLDSARIPETCQWFGATGLSRLDVRIAAGGAVLLAAMVALHFLRPIRRTSHVRRIGLGVLGLVGAGLGVVGQVAEGTAWSAAGLALLGAWWILTATDWRRSGHRRIGGLTLALGIAAVINAVDRSLFMLPWIPMSPSYVTLLLAATWVPSVIVSALLEARRSPQTG